MQIILDEAKKEEGVILGVAEEGGQIIHFQVERGVLSLNAKEEGIIISLIERLLMSSFKALTFKGVNYFRMTDVKSLMTLTA